MHPLIPWFPPLSIPVTDTLSIKGAGLLIVLGFAIGAVFAVRKGRRDGLEADIFYRLLPWIAIGIIVGGHLGHLFLYEPEALWSHPQSLFEVWRGQSSFGGFAACALVAIWFYRRENRRRHAMNDPRLPAINAWAYTDAYLYGFVIGWSICRLGCFSMHDHPGLETNFWLGVYGACPGGNPALACHDMGLYEALWSLVVFLLFMGLDRRPRFPGFFTGLLFILYALSRFPADFLRHPLTDARYLGLTPAQYGSVIMLLLGIWILHKQRRVQPVRGCPS